VIIAQAQRERYQGSTILVAAWLATVLRSSGKPVVDMLPPQLTDYYNRSLNILTKSN
jgi:hypothetical protein